MTIQIAKRIGRALNVRSGTRIKELDDGLREYVRTVPQAPTTPMSGSIDASQVTTGVLGDGRVAESSVTQHQAALSIGWGQLTGVPASFPCDLAADGSGANLVDYADDTAAAAGGVPVGGLYRTGNAVMVRLV